MEMDLAGFSRTQQQALFDLLILAMYADGHLSSSEDEDLLKLLTAMGYAEEGARAREFDTAVTRIRPHLESIQAAKEKAVELAAAFTERSQQKKVYAAVQRIMTSDAHVTTWESTLLFELRLKFRL